MALVEVSCQHLVCRVPEYAGCSITSRRVGLISLGLVKRLVPSLLLYFHNGIFLGSAGGRAGKECLGKNYVMYMPS
jgi:hypothetical protein